MSVSPKFRRCDAVTAAWEGGYVNNAKDPGGPTDRGVTQAKYDEWRRSQGLALKSVKGITAADAEQIFATMFWEPLRCETLAIGVDLATYDSGVNSGVSRGHKWLMASIGGTPADTVKKICAKRLGFMQSLKIWQTFGKGWGRRVADIQAKGVAWALAAAANDNATVATRLQAESAAKQKTAANQGKAAAGTGVAGTGTVAAPHQDVAASAHVADWLLTGIGILVLLAAGYLVMRMILNGQQAQAFAKEAGAL